MNNNFELQYNYDDGYNPHSLIERIKERVPKKCYNNSPHTTFSGVCDKQLENIKLRKCPFCGKHASINAESFQPHVGYYHFNLGCHNHDCPGPVLGFRLVGPDCDMSYKHALSVINKWNMDETELFPANYILEQYPASQEFESVIDSFDYWVGKLIYHSGKVYVEV